MAQWLASHDKRMRRIKDKYKTDTKKESIKFKEQVQVNIFMAWWLNGSSVEVSVLKIEKGIIIF